MIPSPIGASSSRPLANNDRPIVPTPIAKAVNFVCQGQEEFVALAQLPEEKPGRDSLRRDRSQPGGARKNRVVAMREQKQQRRTVVMIVF